MKIPEVLLIESEHRPASLAKILQAIGECGLVIENLNAVSREQDKTIWEITLEMEQGVDYGLYRRIESLPNARLLGHSDRVFNNHLGGKIRMHARTPIKTLQLLRDIYTPGVARVCLAIQDDPEEIWKYTAYGRTVGIVTNGTAVLGLGDIGVRASLPVMEGKAALLAQFGGLSGIPILVDEKDPARIVETVKTIAPSFGAIQLEDVAAPSCFEVEAALRETLDIPVMHDDQHGTAVVTLAALLRVLRGLGRELAGSVIGQIGLGAAGIGIARLLLAYGVESVIGADPRADARARLEGIGGATDSLDGVMAQSEIIIATTGKKGLIRPGLVREGQIILALSNPEPEIEPTTALAQGAAFAADGALVNNALGFPGLFRGALDARAKRFTDAMLFAAAEQLAALAEEDAFALNPLEIELHKAVAQAVSEAARASGACEE
jgi:malate dehydrogenase (oxaloacetate-decarboxylating)